MNAILLFFLCMALRLLFVFCSFNSDRQYYFKVIDIFGPADAATSSSNQRAVIVLVSV